MALCRVPAGQFSMGSEERGESEYEKREGPRHQCELPYDLWMSRYPVTVAQFQEFIAESGYSPAKLASIVERANIPVAWVSWYEAVDSARG